MFISDIFKLTNKLNDDQTSEVANELLTGMKEINKTYPDTFKTVRLNEVAGLATRLKKLKDTGVWDENTVS